MNEQELVSLLKTLGWTYQVRSRRHQIKYIYAKRRNGTKFDELYIAPLSKLDELTSAQITEKLAARPKMRVATKHQSLCKSRCLVA